MLCASLVGAPDVVAIQVPRKRLGTSATGVRMKLYAFGCAIILPLCCAAQNVTGSISGIVQDPSGQFVPDASVTISNQATTASVKLLTDERGDFTANGLQA